MRKLSFDEIRAATLGAVRVCEEERGVRFYRFSEEEEDFYRFRLTEFYIKSLSTAGVKLSFRTDSRRLSLSVSAAKGGSSRSFFSLDVLANGVPVGYVDNYAGGSVPEVPWEGDFAFGDFSGEFDLGDGEKVVTVHLPWSAILSLRELSLDSDASFAPVRPARVLLAYGDSITHGYDASRPHLRQISRLAEALGAAEYNKAIGGEVFCPGLVECPSTLSPDYITVAYGTNDWAKTDFESFRRACTDFYATLTARHPHARIFALTPIPRIGAETNDTFGDFAAVAKTIREVAAKHKNITLIDGQALVPADSAYYSDKFLHPNDAGFAQYAENLIQKISDFLK